MWGEREREREREREGEIEREVAVTVTVGVRLVYLNGESEVGDLLQASGNIYVSPAS